MTNKLWENFKISGSVDTYLDYKSSLENKRDDEKSYDDNRGENLVIE